MILIIYGTYRDIKSCMLIFEIAIGFVLQVSPYAQHLQLSVMIKKGKAWLNSKMFDIVWH